MTLAEALGKARRRLRAVGIEEAGLDAEVLLRRALEISREALLARLQEPLPAGPRAVFEAFLQRRLAHEPTAYIVGHKEFFGLDLACSRAALIPRPESELLVEYAIDWLRTTSPASLTRLDRADSAKGATPLRRPSIVDLGTGTGALAIALALHVPGTWAVAIDTSRPALELARCNAAAHGVADRIAFVQGTLLTPLRGAFDIILANLPYVPSQTYNRLSPEIRENEPEGALRAGRRGTSVIERMLAQAPAHLRPGGLLLAEHGWNQGRWLREAARAAFPDACVETRRDLAGVDRMLVVDGSRPAAAGR